MKIPVVRSLSLLVIIVGVSLLIYWWIVRYPAEYPIFLQGVESRRLPPVQIPDEPQFVEGEVLVKYKENPDSKKIFFEKWMEYKKKGDMQGSRRILQKRLMNLQEEGKKLLSHSQAQTDVQETFPLLAIQQVKGAPGENTDELIQRIKTLAIQQVKGSAGETTAELIKKFNAIEGVEYVKKNYAIYPLSHNHNPPNEELWVKKHYWDNDKPPAKLWGLEKIGIHTVWGNSNLKAQGDIIVSIIDSGVDSTHPDLVANMWRHPDDPNTHGKNFQHQVGYCKKTQGVGDISDETGHGTMVAGIIGAAGDNQSSGAGNEATGALGINWQGHVKLMGLKIFCIDSNGQVRGSVGGAIEAIEYALAMDAHIINASWIVAGVEEEDEVLGLFEAIKKSYANDVLFVTGAGNRPVQDESENWDNDKHPKFPANFQIDNVIAVAATYPNDQLHWESNWGGTTVHTSAPGHGIYSTFSRGVSGEPMSAEGGTSFAAPFVSGCAAYMQAIRKAQGRTLLKPKALREILMKSGDQPKDDNGKLILSKEIGGQVVNLVVEGRRLNCANASQQVASLSP